MIKKIGTRTGKKVICEKCGRNMSQLRPKTKRIGDLEYIYLKCKKCGAVFVCSVTDPPLREADESYKALQARIQTGEKKLRELRADKTSDRDAIRIAEREIEGMVRESRKLLDMNTKRSRELRERYPLNTKGVRL